MEEGERSDTFSDGEEQPLDDGNEAANKNLDDGGEIEGKKEERMKGRNELLGKYARKHLREKRRFESEKNMLFRYLLQYHYLSLHLMVETNMHRGAELYSKTLLGVDTSNLYLFALKYQKQRIRLKLMQFIAELNYYSEVLRELDASHVSGGATLMSQLEMKMKVHEMMNNTQNVVK